MGGRSATAVFGETGESDTFARWEADELAVVRAINEVGSDGTGDDDE